MAIDCQAAESKMILIFGRRTGSEALTVRIGRSVIHSAEKCFREKLCNDAKITLKIIWPSRRNSQPDIGN